MTDPKVTIQLSAQHVLTAEQCFPDGVPDGFTADDVLDAVMDGGVDAWDLGDSFYALVIVTGGGPRSSAEGMVR